MPDFKAYLRNCIDSFFNKSSNRQLMSAQSYPTTSGAITVPVTGDASEGWAILALYTAPCDGVITVSGSTAGETGTCYLSFPRTIFSNAVVTPQKGISLSYSVSAIVKKGEQVRVDGDSFTNVTIKFYKSQGSV